MTVAEYVGEDPQVSLQVVERLTQILDLFASRARSVRVADVATELGLRRSTAHRYLTSLTQVGLLKRDDDDGTYTFGPKLVQLGAVALGRLSVVNVAESYMLRLAAQSRQTVVLTVWGGHGPVIVRAQEDPDALVHIAVTIGRVLSLDTAQAQVFLAFLSDRDTVDRVLTQLPEDRRRELQQTLRGVREHGLASNTLVLAGIRALAAPVFDERGAIVATLGFIGTINGLPDDVNSGQAHVLCESAQLLSGALGYTGGPASIG